MDTLFSESILSWYKTNKRDLPWRSHPTPYHVLVSEIMLQQTQVSRVIEKYNEFLTQFPTIQDLAKASKAEVIQAWSGMGYNRRALLLHQFAQAVVNNYSGKIPQTKEELLKLPGIGNYTAGAILSFAYNQPEPAIDVNIRRIYMRYFQRKDQGLPMGNEAETELYIVIKNTIPPHKSAEFHNALMDFGSLICQRDNPQCKACPLQKSCQFYPLYKTKKEKVLFVMEKKTEKGVSENGKFIPNRIFRGKIVEFVRKNQGKELGIWELGKAIKKDYHDKEGEWLLELCGKLREEGLIGYIIKKEKIKIQLPK